MNNKTKKEIINLERQKKKAIQRHDYIEAAKVCNVIGELLSSAGFHNEAIQAHTEEIQLSDSGDDVIGVAVGNRKVGECLCELRKFEEAIEHQKKHLELAKSMENLLEQQRALATLGRTYYLQSEDFSNEQKKFNKCLLYSQKSYLKSLEICTQLGGTISDKELLEMKARLYLNLGLTYEWKQDIQEALKFVNKALVISREQKLMDDIYRCHFTLSGLYLREQNPQKALQCAKSAIMIAKEENEKQKEVDALQQMGQVLLRLCEFQSAFQTLKKVYKTTLKDETLDDIPTRNLRLAMKGVRLHREVEECTDKEELMILCEKLGDFYSEIEDQRLALKYYLQQCSLAESTGASTSSLASIYISVAITCSDCKEYEKALEYYKKELTLRTNEWKEKSSTYCAMAKCVEDLGMPFEKIKEMYMKGLECAQQSGNKRVELKAYNDWLATLQATDKVEESDRVLEKIKHLKREIEEREGECGGESEEFQGGGVSQFDQEDLQMLESDSDDERDEEEAHISTTTVTTTNRRRSKAKLANKVNERGETPLHLAAIAGNVERAKTLLGQGANVMARDYCGWQPLHEACNHGFLDIVKLLLEYGANVNDAGGSHCGGITPLHDASQNGHLNVVKMLVSYNADVNARCKEGFTPLDLVRNAIKADSEEFSDKYAERNVLFISRKKVEKFLKDYINNANKLTTNNRTPMKDRNKIIFEDYTENIDEEDEQRCLQNPHKRLRTDDAMEDLPYDFENNMDSTQQQFPSQSSEDSVSENENADTFPSSPGLFMRDPSALSNGIPSSSKSVTPRTVNYTPSESSPLKEKTDRMDHSITRINTPTHISGKSDFSSKRKTNASSSTSRNDNDFNITNPRKPFTRVIQSRISFPRSRSPSPSVYDENDSRLHDFIVNDIPTSKNKRNQRKEFDAGNSRSLTNKSSRRSPRKKQKQPVKRKLRQTSVNAFTEVVIQSDDEFEYDEEAFENVRQQTMTSAENIPMTTNHALFRIRVRITDQLYLVPCQQAHEQTIKWLTDQAVERYYAVTKVAAKLILKTKEGAILNLNDVITNVIMSEEEIVGEIVGFKFPPVVDRYRENCRELDIEPLVEMMEEFSIDEEMSHLRVKNVFMQPKDFQAIFSSVTCHATLNILDMSGTFIGDPNLSWVVSALTSLPSIAELNLSNTGITAKGLMLLFKITTKPPKDEYKLIMKGPPLSTLRSLHLSYNNFSNDEGDFARSLKMIFNNCKFLQDLALKNCMLQTQCFTNASLRNAFKDAPIKLLDLSYNEFGSLKNVVDVVSMFNLPSLESLDLSSAISSQNNEKCILKALSDLSRGTKVQRLHLNRLPAFSSCEENYFNRESIITTLSCRHQSCSIDTFDKFVSDISALDHLSCLDVSFSTSFNENHLNHLFENVKTHNSPLIEFKATNCNICSRLPASLCRTLSQWKTSSICVKLIDLSFNEITMDDKNALKLCWESLVRGRSTIQMKSPLFILGVT